MSPKAADYYRDYAKAVLTDRGMAEFRERWGSTDPALVHPPSDEPADGDPRPLLEAARPLGEATAPSDGDGGRRPSAADRLIALAEQHFDLFRDAADEPYGVERDGPPVARYFRGRGSLRAALARLYARAHRKAPPSQALLDALLGIEGQALDAPRREPALRFALTGDRVLIDLADEAGRVAEVGPDGWRLVSARDAGVVWRRSEATAPLPEPTSGGSLEGLLDFVHTDRDGFAQIAAATITAALGLPAPLLVFKGPPGAGKTTAARAIAALVDPSPAPVRSVPRTPDDLAVAAYGSRVLAFDNVHSISGEFSDALCRLVTGDGFARRRLYSNDELVLFAYRRLVILTALDPGALRGDLADRVVALELDGIGEAERREDADLDAAWRSAAPRLFGAWLDLTAAVLAKRKTLQLDRRPRMADFARTLAAVDAVLGTDGLGAHLRQRGELQREAAEGDRVGAAVLRLLADTPAWAGTAEELLEVLTPERPPREWPATPRALSAALRRVATPLASAGVAVAFTREARRRIISLETMGEPAPLGKGAEPSFASFASLPRSDEAPDDDANGPDDDANDDANEAAAGGRHARDDANDADDAKPPLPSPLRLTRTDDEDLWSDTPDEEPPPPDAPPPDLVDEPVEADYPAAAWSLDDEPPPDDLLDLLDEPEARR